jgi:GMP synthase (glutamine-hydrolysing)
MTVELGERTGASALAPVAETALLRDGNSLVGHDEVLVLLLDERDPTGQLLDALARCGGRPAVVRAGGAAAGLPDPAGFRAAIMVGSDRFDDATATGDVGAQVDWLRRADEAGTPVMAVGHGARLLAVAFGGRVTPAEHPVRGWVMVDTSTPHLIPTGPWLTWQHDVISLPPHAQVLAHNRLGPQVFRLGRHLGVQFHPEATRSSAADWAKPNGESSEPDSLVDLVTRDPDAATSSARRLFATFLDSSDHMAARAERPVAI